MDLTPFLDHATSFLLHVVRTGAFFAVVPLFGRQADSAALRIALAVALGGVFWWVGDQTVAAPTDLLVLAVLAIRECVVGFALGFALSLCTSMLVSAGEVVSTEMGFTMARTMNPESGVDATVVSQLLQVVGFLMILQLDLHHEALRILAQTFQSCRVGEAFALEPIQQGLLALVGGSVQLALQYSFPVLGSMLLLSVAMVLLGRAVPAINMQEFGFALRVLLALAALAWLLREAAPFLATVFENLFEGARAMFPV